MDYNKFLEIVAKYRQGGRQVVVKQCKGCHGTGQMVVKNKKHRIISIDHPTCHGTGRIIYGVIE